MYVMASDYLVVWFVKGQYVVEDGCIMFIVKLFGGIELVLLDILLMEDFK